MIKLHLLTKYDPAESLGQPTPVVRDTVKTVELNGDYRRLHRLGQEADAAFEAVNVPISRELSFGGKVLTVSSLFAAS